jgi:hypothetical protein
MKARMVDAGTKYLAISFCSVSLSALAGRAKIFWPRHDARARRAFGNCDDDRLTYPWGFFAQWHAAHLQINGQFLFING